MIAEKEMTPLVVSFLQGLDLHTETEVPLLTKRIDVVGFGRSRLVAVELKIRNWQRALVQASMYQLCADEAYVALPQALCMRLGSQPFQQLGIGLLAVDGTTKLFLPARRSQLIHQSLRQQVLHCLKSNGCQE